MLSVQTRQGRYKRLWGHTWRRSASAVQKVCGAVLGRFRSVLICDSSVTYDMSTSKGFTDSCLIALIGIGEDRWQMPWPKPFLGIIHQGPRLLVGPFADDE